MSLKRKKAPASLLSTKTTWRPLLPRPRRSPASGASRPSLPFNAKLVITPLRRDTRRSSPRRVSPLNPSTVPSLRSRSMSLSCFCLLPAGPVSVDLTKPRPSKTSPRTVTRSVPSVPRSALSVALSPSERAKTGKFAEATSPDASTSTMPLTEAPAPSITKSSIRVAVGCLMSVKVARPARPGGFNHPGSRLSTLACVRSASMAKRLSPSFAATRPLSLIGTGPVRKPARSKPNLLRAFSSRVVWTRISASPSPDPVTDVVGGHLEQGGLHFLAHHHAFGGEVRNVHVDRVERRSGRQILLERQRERHLRGERSAAGRGLDRRVRIVAQPLHAQEFGRGRHRSVETKADLRRWRLGESVGHLEHAVGDRKLTAGRYLNVAAPDIG